MKSKNKIKWMKEPSETNYPAAISYLNLILKPSDVDVIVDDLKKQPIEYFKSKDIFRASRLSLLGVSNYQVEKNIKKIKKGKKLSPILLVRDLKSGMVIIADGYHRTCSVYQVNEEELIPCKITNTI